MQWCETFSPLEKCQYIGPSHFPLLRSVNAMGRETMFRMQLASRPWEPRQAGAKNWHRRPNSPGNRRALTLGKTPEHVKHCTAERPLLRVTACVRGGQILNKPGASPAAIQGGETGRCIGWCIQARLKCGSTKMGRTLFPETPVYQLFVSLPLKPSLGQNTFTLKKQASLQTCLKTETKKLASL